MDSRKVKPLGVSNRTLPASGLSKLPKPSGIPGPAVKRKPNNNDVQNEATGPKKSRPGPHIGVSAPNRTMGKPSTARNVPTAVSHKARPAPNVGVRGNVPAVGNRNVRPGMRRASSTGSLGVKRAQQARTTTGMMSKLAGARSKAGSIPSKPMSAGDKLKDLQQKLTIKEGDLHFKEDEVNRLTAELTELQEILADKEHLVLQSEATIRTQEETINTHTSTITTLRNTLTQVSSLKAQLEAQVQNLETTLAAKDTEIQHKTSEITGLQKTNETHQSTIKMLNERIVQNEQLQTGLQLNIDSLTECLKNKELKITERDCEIAELKSSVQRHLNTIKKLNEKITQHEELEMQMQFKTDSLTESLKLKQAESQGRAERISALEREVEQLEAKSREHETERRRLHNTIQELKGNIRVFCRVRPLVNDEMLGHATVEPDHMSFPEDPRILQLEKVPETGANDTLAGQKKGQKYEFKFDRVFSPSSSQTQVFDEISQLVQSALDGYNVCIFAYGQTGSGKTFTMEGECRDEDKRGMIPRAVEMIFQTASQLADKGWKYEFAGDFLEIYNETIRDLLGEKESSTKHDIKLARPNTTEVVVTNLKTLALKEESQVQTLLNKAAENRVVASTKCNERSSRSHSVFRLHIKGSNTLTQETCASTLNLVDLAGSERLKESGSEGQRLKETQAINKSLANLGNCIMALANKDNHVPYRNSKLTHLLQNSLGGNSKVLMFVNISPKEENTQESLCSLRFATKVNNCNIGTASVVSKK